MSFKDIAMNMAERGVPVIPIPPGEKGPKLAEWPNRATTDAEQIAAWDAENPDYNCGCVAKPDGVWMLDCDDARLDDLIERETGHKIPDTFVVQSRKGLHFYFRQNEASRAMGNRKLGGAFDVQCADKQVVAAGSTHPSGKKYKVVDNSPIVEAPDWLIDWIISKTTTQAPRDSQDFPELHEEFDPEDFFRWYSDQGAFEVTGHRTWKGNDCCITDKCIMAGYKHSGSWHTGFIVGDNTFGYHCESPDCAGTTISTVLTKLRELGFKPYPKPIWAEREIDVEDAALPEDEEAPTPLPKRELNLNDEETTPEPSNDGEPVGDKAPDEQEPELQYPELRFPYEALPEGRLKEMTDMACQGGLEPGLVVPALLGLASGVPIYDEMDGARINMFVCLLALVGAGKDTAIKRARAVLGLREGNGADVTTYAPSGEKAIATLIADRPATKTRPAQSGPRHHVIVTYELEETLNKSRAETSGVLQAMQWYFDNNQKTYTDSKTGTIMNVDCRLSWVTALPVGDTEIDNNAFKRAFGESTSHGLASRMIFGFAEKKFDGRLTRNWKVPHSYNNFVEERTMECDYVGPITETNHESIVSRLRKARVDGFAPGIEQKYLAWAPEKDLSGRDTYHILKVALMVALMNEHQRITAEDWAFAEAFMEWQGKIRHTFSPSRAKRVTQGEFNEIVMDETVKRSLRLRERGESDRHAKIVEEDSVQRCYIRWKQMSNSMRWVKYGMDVERTIDQLVRAGALAYMEELESREDGHDRVKANKAWVRVLNLNKWHS